jgi:hypothetical protein
VTDEFISRPEARALIRDHLNSSIGRAEATLLAALRSEEVRYRYDSSPWSPQLLTADDGIVDVDLRPGAMNKRAASNQPRPEDPNIIISRDDLLDWLDRQRQFAPPTQETASTTEQVARPPMTKAETEKAYLNHVKENKAHRDWTTIRQDEEWADDNNVSRDRMRELRNSGRKSLPNYETAQRGGAPPRSKN